MNQHSFPKARKSYGRFGWPAEWDHPPFPASEIAAAALIVTCRQHYAVMQELIRRQRDERGRRAAKRWARVMMRSGSARVAAMDAAVRHKGLRWNSLAIVRAGLALSLTKRSKEPVLMDLVEKTNGTFRVVYDFGPREYARQKLAYAACKCSERFPGQMFMHSGGVPAAARWLDANVSSSTVVTVTDIPNAFWVLNRERLEADGLLPKSVMQSVLYDAQSVGRRRGGKLLKGGSLASIPESDAYYGNPISPGRSIPPGSAVSSLLAEYRIWRMLEAVQAAHPEVLCGAYLDNIIFLSPSTKKAHAATKALLKAVLDEYGQSVADEVGSRKRTSRASDPAGFWYLNDNYVFENGHLHRRMSEGSIEMYGARLAERIRDEGLGPARIMRSVKGWARQRSYDPRTLDIALELLTDLGVKEDASTVGI